MNIMLRRLFLVVLIVLLSIACNILGTDMTSRKLEIRQSLIRPWVEFNLISKKSEIDFGYLNSKKINAKDVKVQLLISKPNSKGIFYLEKFNDDNILYHSNSIRKEIYARLLAIIDRIPYLNYTNNQLIK